MMSALANEPSRSLGQSGDLPRPAPSSVDYRPRRADEAPRHTMAKNPCSRRCDRSHDQRAAVVADHNSHVAADPSHLALTTHIRR
jgi:hypothetical protein